MFLQVRRKKCSLLLYQEYFTLSEDFMRFFLPFFLLFCILFVPAAARAQGLDPSLPLHLELSTLDDSGRTLVAAVLTPDPGYYLYAQDSADGRPTRLGLFRDGQPLPGEVRYPAPVSRKDAVSGKTVSAYSGRVPIFLFPPEDVDRENLRLGLSLLLCSAQHCVPVDAVVDVPVALTEPWPEGLHEALQASSPGQALTVLPRALSGAAGKALPSVSLTQPPAMSGVTPLEVRPLTPGKESWDFSPRPDDPATEPTNLGMALFWGLLAGLILNVMPCVLPVIALKMSALLHTAGGGEAPLRRFREHNLFFAAGALVWFSLLALAISLLGLTWGGLFQYPPVVAGLALIVCLLGLSMLGLCTLPIIDLKAGTSGSPRSQAFFTGMTATLLATPCSGPLLGGVLAWSALQTPLVTFMVFFSMGVGMALPYVFFATFPRAVRFLPRPGNWLFALEFLVGLFLIGTTVYLLLILPANWSPALVVAFTLLACVLSWRKAPRISRLIAPLLAGGAALWLVLPATSLHARESQIWEPFTTEAFFEALGKEPVLVQFTADWCPNCKALEMTTLGPERLGDWKRRYGLRLFKVDMTLPDADQEALLRAMNSISIPLTALFPQGGQARSPVILRDVYTPARLEAALQALARGAS